MPKHSSKTAPLHRDGDIPAMTQAIDWCISQKLDVIRPSPHQLKIGTLNYYPGTGTIQFDRSSKEREAGLPAFQRKVLQIIDVQATLHGGEYPSAIDVDY